jgi:hypothetical protein
MPRSSRALLPAKIRTSTGRSRRKPILSWAFWRLSRAFPAHRRTGFPAPSFVRFPPPTYGRSAARRFKAFPSARVGRSLAGTPDSLEVLHQGPVLGLSRRQWRPIG